MSFPGKVKRLFVKLNESGKFSSELAKDLCTIEYCKDLGLQTEYPVLRLKGESEFCDKRKHRRYYPYAKFNFSIEANSYIFTNNWFVKNARQLQKFFEQYLDEKFVRKVLFEERAPSKEYSIPLGREQKQRVKTTNASQDWPKWETPTNKEIRKIAESLTPHLKFLHPDIIGKIAESNKDLDTYFRTYLSESKIDIDIYIWEGCSTMFPGIRRANGRTDAEHKKKQLPKELREQKKAIYIDDNSYAKQVWAFIFTNRPFTNRGPDGYELAHLFEHKAVDRLGQELINSDRSDYKTTLPMSGMFTSPAGLIYSPRSFVKISDHSLQARRLLQRKAIQLYHDVTNILPPSVTLKEQSDEWDLNAFKWGGTVGDPANTEQFLKFRKERIQRILDLEIPSR